MFDEDDEPKTKPEEKEKKDKAWNLGDIGMAGNDMMMIGVLVIAFVLFKDEIMGLFNDVGGGGGEAAPTAPVEEAAETPEAPEAEPAEGGGKKRGRRGGRRGAGRVSSKQRRGMRDKARKEAEKSYFGIANV